MSPELMDIARSLNVQADRILMAKTMGQNTNELAELNVDGLIDRLHRTEFPEQGSLEWEDMFHSLSGVAYRLDQMGCTTLAVRLCKAF